MLCGTTRDKKSEDHFLYGGHTNYSTRQNLFNGIQIWSNWKF
jgi:hypothetical protein